MPGAGGTDRGHGQPSRPRVKCGVLGTGPVRREAGKETWQWPSGWCATGGLKSYL